MIVGERRMINYNSPEYLLVSEDWRFGVVDENWMKFILGYEE